MGHCCCMERDKETDVNFKLDLRKIEEARLYADTLETETEEGELRVPDSEEIRNLGEVKTARAN